MGRFLLDIVMGGQLIRLATSPVEVSTRDGDVLLYQEGLGLESVSISATEVPVTLSPLPDLSWPERSPDGAQYERAPATIRYQLDDEVLEDTLVVARGFTRNASWGGVHEPLSLTVDASLIDTSRDMPPATHVVQRDHTWPVSGAGLLDESSEGVPYPIVIGKPGLYLGHVYPTYRGALVNDNAGSSNSHYLVADGDIAASEVSVFTEADPPTERVLAVSPSTDELGISFSKATLVAPTAPETDAEVWIGHGANGGGILGRDGGMAHGAGEVLEIILTDHSDIPLDVGRMRAYQPVLDAYKIDTYIDASIPAYEWVQRALLPLLPVRPAMSDQGLFFAPLKYRADASQVVVHLDADRRDVVRTSGVSPRFDVFNEFSIEAGKFRDGYAITRTLTGDEEALRTGYRGMLADSRVMSDAWCRISQSRYGRISADPLQTACLWDEVTITQVLRDKAEKHALPILGCQYVARTSLALRKLTVGSIVALTDSDIALSEALCVVEDLAYSLDEVVLELSVLPEGQAVALPELPTPDPVPVTPEFTSPADVADLLGWWDAFDSATYNGSSQLSGITDKGPNGYDMTVPSPGVGTTTYDVDGTPTALPGPFPVSVPQQHPETATGLGLSVGDFTVMVVVPIASTRTTTSVLASLNLSGSPFFAVQVSQGTTATNLQITGGHQIDVGFSNGAADGAHAIFFARRSSTGNTVTLDSWYDQLLGSGIQKPTQVVGVDAISDPIPLDHVAFGGRGSITYTWQGATPIHFLALWDRSLSDPEVLSLAQWAGDRLGFTGIS